MSLTDELTTIERQLWTNDAAIYESHFVEDAVLVFPETGRITRAFALDAIRQEQAEGRRWAAVIFDDVYASRVSSDAALLHYRATARWEHDVESITVLASSVYVRLGGSWKVAFHQQSEARE